MKKKIFIVAIIFMVMVSLTTVSLESSLMQEIIDWFGAAADCSNYCAQYNGAFYGQWEACARGCMHGHGY